MEIKAENSTQMMAGTEIVAPKGGPYCNPEGLHGSSANGISCNVMKVAPGPC